MTETPTRIDVERSKQARPARPERGSPFGLLRTEIDRLFDDFAWPDMPFTSMRDRWMEPAHWRSAIATPNPAIDLVERKDAFEVQAEMPGMTPDQIEVKVADGTLVIRGEKTEEHVEDDENRHLSERSYGAIHRAVRMPPGVEVDRAEATFSNGVLSVRIPKSEAARQSERKIEIKAA